jgi:hypothetical protein
VANLGRRGEERRGEVAEEKRERESLSGKKAWMSRSGAEVALWLSNRFTIIIRTAVLFVLCLGASSACTSQPTHHHHHLRHILSLSLLW